jgi:hypothetical protein
LQISLRLTEKRYGIPPSAKKLEIECNKVILGQVLSDFPLDGSEGDSAGFCDFGIPTQAGTPPRPVPLESVGFYSDETTAAVISEIFQLMTALKSRLEQIGMSESISALTNLQDSIRKKTQTQAVEQALNLEK